MAAAKSGSLERGRGGSAASLPGTRGPPKRSHAGTRGAPTQPALKKEIGIPASAPHFHSSGAAAAMWKIPTHHPQTHRRPYVRGARAGMSQHHEDCTRPPRPRLPGPHWKPPLRK